MLTNFLAYFNRFTTDEGLVAACFATASERYLAAKVNGDYSDDELS